jgi:outer membrane protein assembly factor BamB
MRILCTTVAVAALCAGLIGGSALASAATYANANSQSEYSVAFQMNPAHSGNITFANGFGAPLKQIWAEDLGGPVSYPVIAEGLAFVTVGNQYNGEGTQLYALNLASGSVVWEKLIGGNSNWSNAAYDDGRIFLVNGDGEVEASKAATGKFSWNMQLPSTTYPYTAPVARNGTLYVGSAGYPDTLYAISESSGSILWNAALNNTGSMGLPTLGNQGVYGFDGGVFKYNPADGTLLWSINTCQNYCYSSYLTPVYYSKRLYVRSDGGNVILNSTDGTELSYFSANAAPAFFQRKDGLTLVNATLYYYNPISGLVDWKFEGVNGDGGLVTAPIVVNGLVIEGAAYGNLYALDGATGNLLWSTNVGTNISGPNEGNTSVPLTGLGAGQGTLIVPAGNQIFAYVPQ